MRGDIVGQTGDTRQPFVMRDGRGEPVTLPLPPDATTGDAVGVDEDGTIVGYVDGPGGSYVYLWYPNGKTARAPLPARTDNSYGALKIRNGWVIGDKTSEHPTFRWNIRTGTVRSYPQLSPSPGGVNRHGWIAGRTNSDHAILISDTEELVLPGLKPFVDRRTAARAVTDDGRTVAGEARGTDKAQHAAVWRS